MPAQPLPLFVHVIDCWPGKKGYVTSMSLEVLNLHAGWQLVWAQGLVKQISYSE